MLATYVTRPAKTGRICTQILHHFSKFNLALLCTYYCYLNKTFRTYSKIYNELYEACRSFLSYITTEKYTFFWACVICADMPGFRRPRHIYKITYLCMCVPCISYCSHGLLVSINSLQFGVSAIYESVYW